MTRAQAITFAVCLATLFASAIIVGALIGVSAWHTQCHCFLGLITER